MAHNLTSVANGLMEKSDPVYLKHIYNKSRCAKKFRAQCRKGVLGGRSGLVTWSTRVGDAYAVGIHGDGGDFATAGTSQHELFTLSGVSHNFPGEFTGELQDIANDQDWAWVAKSLKQTQDELLSSMQHYLASTFYQNGDGVFALTDSLAVNTFTCTTGFGVRHLRKGMVVSAHLANAGADLMTDGTIIAVDRVAQTFTVEDATGATALGNDSIYVSGTFGQGAMNGLRNLMTDTGTVQGQNRVNPTAAYTIPFIKDLGATALTELDVTEVRDYVYNYSPTTDEVTLITGTSENMNKMFLLVADQWRFADKSDTPVGWGTNVAVYTVSGQVMFLPDPFCHQDDVYFLTPSSGVCYYPKGKEGGAWYAPSGNRVLGKTGTTGGTWADAYQIVRVFRGNMGFDEFQSNAVLRDFT